MLRTVAPAKRETAGADGITVTVKVVAVTTKITGHGRTKKELMMVRTIDTTGL